MKTLKEEMIDSETVKEMALAVKQFPEDKVQKIKAGESGVKKIGMGGRFSKKPDSLYTAKKDA